MSNELANRRAGFTVEQRQAVETRDVSVALSAGAGCGKTFVLTERFLDYFRPESDDALRPEDLGHLVAITFTERAAREMRDRIRRKCYDLLLKAQDQHATYWAALLRALDTARISTIHSFCGALLRSRAVEAQFDPQFEVLEQSQADTLLSETIDDELRRLVAEQDPVTFELAVRFDLAQLREMLRDLVLACTADQFETWAARDTEEILDIWRDFHRAHVVPAIVRQVGRSASVQTVLALLSAHVPSHAVMQARRQVLLERLTPFAEGTADVSRLADDLAEIHTNARVQGGGTAKVWPSEAIHAELRDALTDLRKLVDGASTVARFERASATEAAVVGRQLLTLAQTVAAAYRQKKHAIVALDFNDLLTRARHLLTAPEQADLRRQLSGQLRLLLVDEFQDTDRQQVELVAALCGEGAAANKLFFVGDFKQSIYRFRGADPDVFRELRDQTPAAGRQSLTLNFRSQPAILEFVNALFWHDLGPEYEPLRPHRPQVSPRPAIEFLWAPMATDQKENVDALRRREAAWIARRVRMLLDDPTPTVWDADANKAGRPATRRTRPGDVAILFRALSNVEYYEEALRQQGIDYYLVGGKAFYAQQEIFDLLNLLRTLDSQSDLVSLVGTLRSGFFALADETIFWLAQHPSGLAAGLFAEELPTQLSTAEAARARFAAETILALRARKDRVRICELINEALARTGYDAALVDEFLGERKLANLRKLVDQARSFERGGFFGLADFIAQLAEFVAREPDEPLAATHSEDTNVVRLMSIHQSKGLEFPIVVVPDVDRPRRHGSRRVHFDPRLGPLVRLGEARGVQPGCGGYELWRYQEHEQELAELHRLLYVATTRAADRLILASGVQQLGVAKGPWMELLASRFDLLTGKLNGPLPTDQPRPDILVTTTEPPAPRGESSQRMRVDWEQVTADVVSLRTNSGPRLNTVDPVAPDAAARRLFSFSRLAGSLHPKTEPLDDEAPPFAAAGNALALGTLVHQALAAIDFRTPGDARALVRRLAERMLLDDPRAVADALTLVERFLQSPRALALASATESHAEIDFLLAWPPQQASPAPALLEGVIDRLYRDAAGDWHVLDFKTNRVSTETVAERSAPYEMQMLVYALAVERILGTAPRSVTLHFLRIGAEHCFAWNERARRRAEELVAAGIAAARTLTPAPVHLS